MYAQEDHSIQEIKTGIWQGPGTGRHTCLVCGDLFEEGEVYPIGGRFYTAEKAAAMHIADDHGERLGQLLASENKYLSLTDHQKRLLCLLAQGLSDADIAAETGASAATVRRQRFAFREKAKQARMFLAAYELAEESRQAAATAPLALQEGVDPILQQYQITKQEYDKTLKSAFFSLSPLRLRALPSKDKKRFAAMARIAQQFEAGRDYTEKEVNAILEEIYQKDYVLLRRYLIEYKFLSRENDGSRYWLAGELQR